MFNVSSEQALINIAGTLGDRIFNIEDSISIDGVQSINVNMSLGLTLTPIAKPNTLMTCGPLWAQRCGSQYFYPGVCAEVSPQFTLQSSFSPAIQTCGGPMDVAIVLDGSNSIYPWPDVRNFLIKLLENLDIGPDKTRVSIMQYSEDLSFLYHFSSDQNKDKVLSAASGIEQKTGTETNTFEALDNVRQTAFLPENGGRPGATKVLVVVTDGESADGSKGQEVIERCNRDGIIRFGIAKILGSKLGPALRFFGRSLDSRADMNGDSIPDISVGAAGKAVQLWSRGVAAVTTTVSFSPEKISILSKPCMFGGRMVSCVSAKVCFRSKFRPTVLAGKVDIKYNLTLDADLQSSRATSRAQFDNSERLIQKPVSVSDKESCVDHNVYVQETPDFVSPVALRVDISPQNPDTGPALDAFQPKAWEFFIPFVKDCGSDDKCSCDLKLTVKAVHVSSSSSLLVRPDRRRLSFVVTVTNMKENAYNTRVSANFSRNLFYASFTPPGDNTEVKCSSKTGSLDCRVGYPNLTPGQTVTFEINFDFNLNQLEKQAVVNFEVQSDSEEEVTSDNKVSLSIPVQYDAEIILTRDLNLDFCGIGSEDQVKHTVSGFDDIGPEFDITLQVSTGTFPIDQAHLTVSLPTSTKAGNPLLYVISVKTAPVVNVWCDSSHLIDPLKIREKTHTASFTKESFRGTAELDCKAAKCETMTCVLKDLEMKTNYFVNITTRIWNGTFAFADFQTVLVAGSSEIQTSQPDLIVVTHKQQQIKITVSKEGAIGDIPIGIIIGSVIGGLLLWALATVILWKVGFFKRKTLPQGNEPDPSEQEGLCENPA
ncbi:integrin alpha-2-like [Sinocyclocheilus rhinocerous]|uniref:integrin alpha-2-like n=1 Tax=Sinocyclocheilus rhinocerous TaxID=307959 RepID=UPI0007B9B438|nr:PREDICTED: integrin alpha-2-like [Sinocyclocheilus rhinocerous]